MPKKMKDELRVSQSGFVMLSHCFLESKLLSPQDKLCFIYLKKHADKRGICFPSLSTLATECGLSKRSFQRSINNLKELKIIKVKQRKDEKGYHSNLYTLYDYEAIWKATTAEEVEKITQGKLPYSNEELIAELKRRGVILSEDIKKEPVAAGTADGSVDSSDNVFGLGEEHTKSTAKVQEGEVYPMEYLKELYHYDLLLSEYKLSPAEVDAVLAVLYDSLNSSGKVKIGGQDKSCEVVKAKILDLTPESISYSIRMYKEQKDKIKNPKGYLLTILYGAKEQMVLDYVNQVAQVT